MPIQKQSPVLLACDQSASVLRHLGAGYDQSIAYSPFGFHVPGPHRVLSGFNGQVLEFLTLGYLLGSGYRLFIPELLRFPVPDDRSPFDEGWINAYGYCGGDPQNRQDPSGHSFFSSIGKGIQNRLMGRKSTEKIAISLSNKNVSVSFSDKQKVYAIYPGTSKITAPPINTLLPRSKNLVDARSISNNDITLWSNTPTSYTGIAILNRTQLKNIKSLDKLATRNARRNPARRNVPLEVFTRDLSAASYRPPVTPKKNWLLNPSNSGKHRIRTSI